MVWVVSGSALYLDRWNLQRRRDTSYRWSARARWPAWPQNASMWPGQQPSAAWPGSSGRGLCCCSIRRACAGEPGAVQSQVSRWACDYYFQARLTWPLPHSMNSCFARFTETPHERPFFFPSLLCTQYKSLPWPCSGLHPPVSYLRHKCPLEDCMLFFPFFSPPWSPWTQEINKKIFLPDLNFTPDVPPSLLVNNCCWKIEDSFIWDPLNC